MIMDDSTIDFISIPATTSQYIPPAPGRNIIKTEFCIGMFITIALVICLQIVPRLWKWYGKK